MTTLGIKEKKTLVTNLKTFSIKKRLDGDAILVTYKAI